MTLPSPPTSPRTATARIRLGKRTRSLGNVTALVIGSDLVHGDHTEEPDDNNDNNKMVVGKRRPSSIVYYTPTSPSPWSQRSQFNRTPSSSVDGPSRRSSLVLSPRSTRESLSSTEPLTLVEKHADILHLIAQKERKCLELRDQLAVHEMELEELKRKWERVVNHGHDPLPNSAGLGGAALDGLKEGVRMITAGFSDLGSVIQEVDSGDTKPKASRRNHSDPSANQTGNLDGPVTTTPLLSRAGSLNSRMHKRASRVFAAEDLLDPTSTPPEPTLSDMRMTLILSPSPTLVPPPLSTDHTSASTSSWMDNMGKKLSGLQKSPTFSKGQKRASSFLAGVSHTITAALSPGPTPTTPAPLPSTITTTARIHSSTVPPLKISTRSYSHPHPHPTYKTMADWLDDNDGEEEDKRDRTVHVRSASIRAPKLSEPHPRLRAETPVSSFDDDTDWNWS